MNQTIDRAKARAIQDELAEAVRPILEAHGLKVAKGRASYDVGMFRFTVEAHSTGDNDPKVVDWGRYAEGFGLPKGALGREMTYGSKRFRIVGLLPSRRRFPVVATRLDDGKELLLEAESVKRALAREDAYSAIGRAAPEGR